MNILTGKDSFENAYIEPDYPYGYRLRTERRTWVETKPGKGQRIVHVTKNPRTGNYNAPKYSTYWNIIILSLDENGHIVNNALGHYVNESEVREYGQKYSEYFTDWQQAEWEKILIYARAGSKLTWNVTENPAPLTPEEEKARKEKETRTIALALSLARQEIENEK